MKPNKSIHPRARIGSIGFALRGMVQLVRQEPNAKLHFAATVSVIIAGYFRHISRHDWMAIVFAIVLVWMAEALNTAIEMLCDLWCNGEYHPKIKIIKDVSAAAVLMASMASVIIAGLVFFF